MATQVGGAKATLTALCGMDKDPVTFPFPSTLSQANDIHAMKKAVSNDMSLS